jgi:hypothetical protein
MHIDHINLEVAKQFLNDPNSTNISKASTIDDEAAALISTFVGGDLVLDGLIELSDKAAEFLSNHKGWLLKLNGITHLSENAAKSLINHKGGNLEMEALGKKIHADHTISQEIAFLSFKSSYLVVDPSLLSREKIIELYNLAKKYCDSFNIDIYGLKDSDKISHVMLKIFKRCEKRFSLDDTMARVCGEFCQMIYFPQLSTIDVEIANDLSPIRCSLALPNLERIDKQSLQALLIENCKYKLHQKYKLNHCLELGIKSINGDISSLLSKYAGDISLPKLAEIDETSARNLRGVTGNLLLGIAEIDEKIAKSLTDLPKKNWNRNLYLPEAKKLSTSVLEILSSDVYDGEQKYSAQDCRELILGIHKLEIDQALILSKRCGLTYLPKLQEADGDTLRVIAESISQCTLDLNCFKSLSADQAAGFSEKAKATCILLNGLRLLEPGVAFHLSRCQCHLHLDGLENLNPSDASLLAEITKRDGPPIIHLCGLLSLNESIASSLSNFDGVLYLDGVKSLDKKVAEVLISSKPKLSLRGVREIDEDVAKILGSRDKKIVLSKKCNMQQKTFDLISKNKELFID